MPITQICFRFLENATMVLFHGKGLTTKALPVGNLAEKQIKVFLLLESPLNSGIKEMLPIGNLTEKQIKVFLLLESPLNSGIKDILPSDFFDLTVTYRSDSDIHMPYDSFLRIDASGAKRMNYTTWTQSEVSLSFRKAGK
uniref:Glyco_tran_10_N domain-containing protein n=1 Tax=Steinernema glaseri TaxID=37863 RepID=A0A1I7ZK07_9BILA